jgi:hypothetical protein
MIVKLWGESSGIVQLEGASPQRDIHFSIDAKGGEIVALMWRDDH